MFAKINHVAIVSDNYAQLAKFYEAVFGMTNVAARPRQPGGDGGRRLCRPQHQSRVAPADPPVSIISASRSMTSRPCSSVCARTIRT